MTTEYLLNTEVDRVLGCLTPVNRLACETMLHTGLRIGDVLALRKDQLRQQFWITEQKTGKRRRVNLTEDLLSALMATPGQWAFPGRDPRRARTRQAVWKDLKRAAKAYRLKSNVGTHSMRKIYATDLMHKYGDIERVRRALSHSNVAVTLIYALADIRMQRTRKAPKRVKRS